MPKIFLTHKRQLNILRAKESKFLSIYYFQADGYAVEEALQQPYAADHLGEIYTFGQQAGFGINIRLKPDILNTTRKVFNEVKPLSIGGLQKGSIQVALYELCLGYSPDIEWEPMNPVLNTTRGIFYVKNIAGIIFYTDLAELHKELKDVKTIQQAKAARAKVLAQHKYTSTVDPLFTADKMLYTAPSYISAASATTMQMIMGLMILTMFVAAY